MVAEFVRRALAAAGVEHVEREPGLIRVYPHPLLEDLFAGEPYLELGCTDTLLPEHPGAVLCIPGSYPLDRILALVRELPRAFSTAAAFELPAEPPPAAPGVENAATELRFQASGDRTAARLLAKVRIQSDETVEHLAWVAVDGSGRDRPDLLPHWDAAPRTASVAAGEPVALDSLERQALKAAAALAEDYGRSAYRHREHERARLEGFHRSRLQELPSLLPAGPGRRLAEGRAQLQAFTELLLASLPGKGPWKKEALLPRGLWPFRRPGLLPPLAAEARLRLYRVLPHLPPVFGSVELEASAAAEAAPRLKRLEERLAADVEDRARLTHAEQRLRQEHAGRVADLERKLEVRTVVTPRLIEALRYPAALFEMRVQGGPDLTAAWDPLARAWEPIACPTCWRSDGRLWLSGNRTVGCDHCTSRCSGCERVEPRTAPLTPCAGCGAPACEQCGARCEECAGWHCARHVARCSACGRRRCATCGASCDLCGGAACRDHPEVCGVCRKTLCAPHQARCGVCEAVVCPDDRVRCGVCLCECCAPHRAACRDCGLSYCARCVSSGRCATCRDPQPAGDATAAALASQIAALLPGLKVERLGGWTLARNARCRVVTARGWPWVHRFVIDDESGALRKHSREWKPL